MFTAYETVTCRGRRGSDTPGRPSRSTGTEGGPARDFSNITEACLVSVTFPSQASCGELNGRQTACVTVQPYSSTSRQASNGRGPMSRSSLRPPMGGNSYSPSHRPRLSRGTCRGEVSLRQSAISAPSPWLCGTADLSRPAQRQRADTCPSEGSRQPLGGPAPSRCRAASGKVSRGLSRLSRRSRGFGMQFERWSA